MSGPNEAQLTHGDCPFDLVIFCNDDNERYYDRAYDAAMGQQLPFANIHRVKLSSHIAADWRKVELKSDWVFRINADIALDQDATLKLLPNLADSTVGVIKCGTRNAVVGKLFSELHGTPDLMIYKTSAITQALAGFSALNTFDLTPLIALAKFRTVLLHSKTRKFDRIHPGLIADPKMELVQLGTNISDWAPAYLFRWFYRLGAQLYGAGMRTLGTMAESISTSGHEHWQLALAAYVQGFTSGLGPREINDGMLDQLAQKAAFLGGHKPAKRKYRTKVL